MLQYFRGVLERHQTCAFSKFHSGVQTRRKAQLSATMPSSNSKPRNVMKCPFVSICCCAIWWNTFLLFPRGSQFETPHRLWDLQTVMWCACRFFMPIESVWGSHIERTRSGHRMRRMSRSTWHVRRIIDWTWLDCDSFPDVVCPQYLLQIFSSSNLSCATSIIEESLCSQ